MAEGLYVYGGETTIGVWPRDDGGLFVASDAFNPDGGDRLGQIRLNLSESEAKTLISALRYVLAQGGPEEGGG